MTVTVSSWKPAASACIYDFIEAIKGIGPALAEGIIAGRPYESMDELVKVKGIREH